jgi:hypothetical protein
MIDFLIIGGTKCGSTSLADYVSLSSNVNFCHEKEPAILNKKDLTNLDIEHYRRLYDNRLGLKGEATPAYSDYGQVDVVINNLRIINARPKIILSVRNQIKRIESSHFQKIKGGKVKVDDLHEIQLKPGVLNRGMYGAVVEKYIKEFSTDDVLVLNFDLLIKPNSTELIRLKKFLGLENDLPDTLPKSNTSVRAKKKHWIFKFYKNYLYIIWKRFNLPSFRLFVPMIEKISKNVEPSSKTKLTMEQIDYIKDFYSQDAKLFEQLCGWSYWQIEN